MSAAPKRSETRRPPQAGPRGTIDSRADARLDGALQELVEARFHRLLRQFPVQASFLGIHTEDHRLGDLTREAFEGHVAAERAHLNALEALDPLQLSHRARFERDLAIHAVRLGIFGDTAQRLWERKPTAVDEIGDGVFSLLFRDFAALSDRMDAVASRLAQVPRVLAEQRERLGPAPIRLWIELEVRAAEELPRLFDDVLAAGRRAWPPGHPGLRRLEDNATGASRALADYAGWLRALPGPADGDWRLGRERFDELIALRAFDGLTADEIVEIGWQQLAAGHEGRRAAARQIDSSASEAEVLDRVKSDHPPTFDAAAGAYREAMLRSRSYVLEHDLLTLPAGEALDVMTTPDFLRNAIPFAAYYAPARFDRHPEGIYVVTPSVDGDPRAVREHNYASISNTSIHEAYPGHHVQLSAALLHPSLVRALTEAPEFVEGWAMYCEQMMREEGYDDGPVAMLAMYTDAIWRACRIILDVRLQRGEIGVDDAVDFLVGHTGFERPQARAEVQRYTYTPSYQLSYLLGKVLLLHLRDDERRRLGAGFSLKRFHDQLLYAGSLPISFHRRLLAGEGGPPEEALSLAGRPPGAQGAASGGAASGGDASDRDASGGDV